MTRADVLDLGDKPISEENAWQLLYATLAWGLGPKASRLHARLDGLARHPDDATDRLCAAWDATRQHTLPADCYRQLLDERGMAQIPWLGAAFATKFLYFAQGRHARPRNLILDRVVATALRTFAWPSSPLTAWLPETYSSYCDLLDRWAREAARSSAGEVAPDQIEYLLFNLRQRDKEQNS